MSTEIEQPDFTAFLDEVQAFFSHAMQRKFAFVN